ncbi:30S ribosomal protein S8 [Mogibacterium diversum]|uniref:30S ribosomal protein S8 n=1 Tax=Mogibacterium diversum TaxID=114527 RepID=UPI0028D19049|nr:30S ribosomal protein S8 [Mogibacterium diversum]
MAMTDPIADMLTRIRNANTAGHAKVEIPASKMKKSIAEILKNEGFIKDFSVAQDNAQGTINVELKYGPNKEKTIYGIKKISKPGLRVYAKADQVPKVLGGLGIAIVSTSKGVISDKEARKLGVGGEVICYVW